MSRIQVIALTGFTGASIILGAVDEAHSIEIICDYLMETCPEDIAEIIIVKSKNCTAECARCVSSVKAEYGEKILVITQNRPSIGGAIWDGMELAHGSHTILLASDLAHDMSVVPQMTESAKRAPELICTVSRWLGGSFYGYSKARKILNYCAQVFLRILYGVRLTDFTNPVQIAPAQLYKDIEWEDCGFPFLLEMTLKPLRLGYKFTEIPTNCYPRTEGKSKNSFPQTAKYLGTALHIRFMKKEKLLKNYSPEEKS